MKLTLKIIFMLLVLMLVIPASALAHDVAVPHTLVLPSNQIWLALIGGLVPLVTYVLNHIGPWVTEPIKAAVLVIVSAVAGGLYTAVTTNQFGWNTTTAQLVLTAVVAALAAHHLLWKPSGIAQMLGAGSNRRYGGYRIVRAEVQQQPPPSPLPPSEPVAGG